MSDILESGPDSLATSLRSILALDEAVFDALPMGVYACDRAGRIIRANRRACELWGRKPRLNDDDERFCASFRLFSLDGAPIPREATPMAIAVRDGIGCAAVEALVENPDGRRWVGSVNIQVLRDDRGEVVGALNCFQDVTASHQLRLQAQRDSAFLRAVVEATPECIKIVAPDGTLTEMNAAGAAMVGADHADEVRGLCTFDLIAPEDRARWIENHQRVCGGETLDWEFDILGIKGKRRHMETHAVPLRLPDGRLAQLAVTRDITDRRDAEVALREAEARHREILQSLPMPVYTTDAEGRITFFNPAAVEFAGRTPELGGDSWCISWKLLTLDGQPLAHEECPFAVSLREGSPRLGIDEAIAETPDGRRRQFLPFATPLRDAEGRIVGGLNMLVDVTDIRKTERALARRAREQASLYRFTDRLYRTTDAQEAHEAALDAITEALGCERASILLADAEGVLRFAAWRGLSDGYRAAVEGHSPWKPGEVDPEPVWVSDIERTEEPQAIKDVVLAEGIRGLAFIPLTAGGKLVGKFMVYYPEAHEFTEAETGLALTISRQLGFFVEQRRAEALRAEAEEMLRDREQRLSAMFTNAGVGMVLMSGDCQIISANPAFCRISERGLGELVGSTCLAFTHSDDIAANRQAAADLMKGAGPVGFEKRYLLPDGRERWVRINLNRVAADEVVAVVEDIDDRRRAEEQKIQLLEERSRAEMKMRQQAEEFYTLADNIPTLCWMAYADGHIYWYNRRWYDYTGTSPETQEGWGWESVHDPEVLPAVVERWNHSLATGEPFEMTFPLRGADGEFRPFLTRVVPIRDESGRIQRWFGTNTDVAVQARQQEHLKLLINELNHRVKNTLATIQSMAARSLRNAPSLAEALEAFEGRLLALSRAHNRLTESNWEGADLKGLVVGALEPFAVEDGKRVRLSGRSVWLPQRTAISLAMVLHELATNATKYGALSNDRGSLSVRWTVSNRTEQPRRLVLDWRERGGPRLTPPERQGFGSRLIERTVRTELGGRLEVDYDPLGIRVHAAIPLHDVPAERSSPEQWLAAE